MLSFSTPNGKVFSIGGIYVELWLYPEGPEDGYSIEQENLHSIILYDEQSNQSLIKGTENVKRILSYVRPQSPLGIAIEKSLKEGTEEFVDNFDHEYEKRNNLWTPLDGTNVSRA